MTPSDLDTGAYRPTLPPVLFERGDFFLTTERLKDEAGVEGATRLAFVVMHKPTGVRVAITSVLSAGIRCCVIMDKDVKDTLRDPDAACEEQPGQGGFGGGFPGFG